MLAFTLIPTGLNLVRFRGIEYSLLDENDTAKLVLEINNCDSICAVDAPMQRTENKLSILEILIKNGVNTSKLVSKFDRISFYSNLNNAGHISYNKEEQCELDNIDSLRLNINILIGWIKTTNKLLNIQGDINFNSKHIDTVAVYKHSGYHCVVDCNFDRKFIATQDWDRVSGLGVGIPRLDSRKYYTIRISNLYDDLRYFTGETYAEMLARYYKEFDSLKSMGPEKYINYVRLNRNTLNDIESHIITDYQQFDVKNNIREFNVKLTSFLNDIVDNKESFLISICDSYEIAFKNNVPVLEALKKILNSISDNMPEYMIQGLSVVGEDNYGLGLEWNSEYKRTCSINMLRSNIESITGQLMERTSTKSSNCENDIISVFNYIKSLNNEWIHNINKIEHGINAINNQYLEVEKFWNL